MQHTKKTITQKQNPSPCLRVKTNPNLSSSKLLHVDLQHFEGAPTAAPLEFDQVFIEQAKKVSGAPRPKGGGKKQDFVQDVDL